MNNGPQTLAPGYDESYTLINKLRENVTSSARALELIGSMGLARPRDLAAHGISREQLRRLLGAGLIQQHGRGVYSAANTMPTANHSLAQMALMVPAGVVCLLSALRFHGFTTAEPHKVWLALPLGSHQPQIQHPPLQTVRMNHSTYTAAVERHTVDGVTIQVYSPAKTVADCFKFRNRVGHDLAIEALTEGWRQRRFTQDELWQCAKLCRVSNVLMPYLEAVVAGSPTNHK